MKTKSHRSNYQNCKYTALCLIVGGLATTACYGTLIFDNASQGNDQTFRGAGGDSPLAAITVSAPTTINAIGALVDLDTPGNLKFVIFNLDTSALLFSTGPQAFADDGLAYKVSSDFAPFVLSPGINYGIGGIADVAGAWEFGFPIASPFTQNGITAANDRNGNDTNFASPTFAGDGGAMVMVQLYAPSASTVPDAGTTSLLLAVAMAALAIIRWKLKGAWVCSPS